MESINRCNNETIKNRRNKFNISIRRSKNSQIVSNKRQKILCRCETSNLDIKSNTLKVLINEFFVCYTKNDPEFSELAEKIRNIRVGVLESSKIDNQIVSIFLEQSMLSPILDLLSTKYLESQEQLIEASWILVNLSAVENQDLTQFFSDMGTVDVILSQITNNECCTNIDLVENTLLILTNLVTFNSNVRDHLISINIYKKIEEIINLLANNYHISVILDSFILDYLMAFSHNFTSVEPMLHFHNYSKVLDLTFECILLGRKEIISDACHTINYILKSASDNEINLILKKTDVLDELQKILVSEDNLAIKNLVLRIFTELSFTTIQDNVLILADKYNIQKISKKLLSIKNSPKGLVYNSILLLNNLIKSNNHYVQSEFQQLDLLKIAHSLFMFNINDNGLLDLIINLFISVFDLIGTNCIIGEIELISSLTCIILNIQMKDSMNIQVTISLLTILKQICSFCKIFNNILASNNKIIDENSFTIVSKNEEKVKDLNNQLRNHELGEMLVSLYYHKNEIVSNLVQKIYESFINSE